MEETPPGHLTIHHLRDVLQTFVQDFSLRQAEGESKIREVESRLKETNGEVQQLRRLLQQCQSQLSQDDSLIIRLQREVETLQGRVRQLDERSGNTEVQGCRLEARLDQLKDTLTQSCRDTQRSVSKLLGSFARAQTTALPASHQDHQVDRGGDAADVQPQSQLLPPQDRSRGDPEEETLPLDHSHTSTSSACMTEFNLSKDSISHTSPLHSLPDNSSQFSHLSSANNSFCKSESTPIPADDPNDEVSQRNVETSIINDTKERVDEANTINEAIAMVGETIIYDNEDKDDNAAHDEMQCNKDNDSDKINATEPQRKEETEKQSQEKEHIHSLMNASENRIEAQVEKKEESTETHKQTEVKNERSSKTSTEENLEAKPNAETVSKESFKSRKSQETTEKEPKTSRSRGASYTEEDTRSGTKSKSYTGKQEGNHSRFQTPRHHHDRSYTRRERTMSHTKEDQVAEKASGISEKKKDRTKTNSDDLQGKRSRTTSYREAENKRERTTSYGEDKGKRERTTSHSDNPRENTKPSTYDYQRKREKMVSSSEDPKMKRDRKPMSYGSGENRRRKRYRTTSYSEGENQKRKRDDPQQQRQRTVSYSGTRPYWRHRYNWRRERSDAAAGSGETEYIHHHSVGSQATMTGDQQVISTGPSAPDQASKSSTKYTAGQTNRTNLAAAAKVHEDNPAALQVNNTVSAGKARDVDVCSTESPVTENKSIATGDEVHKSKSPLIGNKANTTDKQVSLTKSTAGHETTTESTVKQVNRTGPTADLINSTEITADQANKHEGTADQPSRIKPTAEEVNSPEARANHSSKDDVQDNQVKSTEPGAALVATTDEVLTVDTSADITQIDGVKTDQAPISNTKTLQGLQRAEATGKDIDKNGVSGEDACESSDPTTETLGEPEVNVTRRAQGEAAVGEVNKTVEVADQVLTADSVNKDTMPATQTNKDHNKAITHVTPKDQVKTEKTTPIQLHKDSQTVNCVKFDDQANRKDATFDQAKDPSIRDRIFDLTTTQAAPETKEVEATGLQRSEEDEEWITVTTKWKRWRNKQQARRPAVEETEEEEAERKRQEAYRKKVEEEMTMTMARRKMKENRKNFTLLELDKEEEEEEEEEEGETYENKEENVERNRDVKGEEGMKKRDRRKEEEGLNGMGEKQRGKSKESKREENRKQKEEVSEVKSRNKGKKEERNKGRKSEKSDGTKEEESRKKTKAGEEEDKQSAKLEKKTIKEEEEKESRETKTKKEKKATKGRGEEEGVGVGRSMEEDTRSQGTSEGSQQVEGRGEERRAAVKPRGKGRKEERKEEGVVNKEKEKEEEEEEAKTRKETKEKESKKENKSQKCDIKEEERRQEEERTKEETMMKEGKGATKKGGEGRRRQNSTSSKELKTNGKEAAITSQDKKERWTGNAGGGGRGVKDDKIKKEERKGEDEETEKVKLQEKIEEGERYDRTGVSRNATDAEEISKEEKKEEVQNKAAEVRRNEHEGRKREGERLKEKEERTPGGEEEKRSEEGKSKQGRDSTETGERRREEKGKCENGDAKTTEERNRREKREGRKDRCKEEKTANIKGNDVEHRNGGREESYDEEEEKFKGNQEDKDDGKGKECITEKGARSRRDEKKDEEKTSVEGKQKEQDEESSRRNKNRREDARNGRWEEEEFGRGKIPKEVDIEASKGRGTKPNDNRKKKEKKEDSVSEEEEEEDEAEEGGKARETWYRSNVNHQRMPPLRLSSLRMDGCGNEAPEAEVGMCANCGFLAKLRCANCRQAFYCKRECQREHWKKGHKDQCQPFQVLESTELGRYVVATRDLKAGDIILKEDPLVMGPKQITEPICLGCYKHVDGSYRCGRCGWPMCGAECCASADHQPECVVGQEIGSPIEIVNFEETNHFYEVIFPMRCLALKKKSARKYEQLLSLESHYEDRKGTHLFQENQKSVVNFLRNYFFLQEFPREDIDSSERTIHTMTGIIDVNALEVRLEGGDVLGLYPTFAMLEHSCTPNTKHTFTKDRQVVLRASVDIRRGEHISTMYTHVLWGTAARRDHLKHSKYFMCTCPRCSDPTELGTHFSALRCRRCKSGFMLSAAPLDQLASWICTSCNATLTAEEVMEANLQLGEEVETVLASPSVAGLEEMIQRHTSTTVHPNHYHLFAARHTLLQLYGRDPTAADQASMKKKEKLCQDFLKVCTALDPGMSRLAPYAGVALYEYHLAVLARARQDPDAAIVDSAALKKDVETAKALLQQCIRVLQDEPEHQPEGQLCRVATQNLAELRQWEATLTSP